LIIIAEGDVLIGAIHDAGGYMYGITCRSEAPGAVPMVVGLIAAATPTRSVVPLVAPCAGLDIKPKVTV
jgi:hypothetical protein